jgi:cell division protein FtsL
MEGPLPQLQRLRRSLSFTSVRTWLLLVATLVLLGSVYMGQASQAAMTGHRVLDKQDKLTRLTQENIQLQADIAALLAPDRIEKRAQALGFHLASPDQIKYVVVKDYPVQTANADLPASRPTASTATGRLDLSAWWNDLLVRTGLNTGPHAAEATTNP